MSRLISIDIAKAICIILVVIGHYHPDSSPEWYHTFNRLIYSFHMPLFLFASGYVYLATYKKESYWNFLNKKIKRLMIPYIMTSIIIISIKLITQRQMLVESEVTYFSYVEMFYLPVAGYFLWFIWALFLMFLIVPHFKTPKARIFLFVVSVILHYLALDFTDLFCVNQFKGMFMYFMLGVLSYEYRHSIILEKIKRIPFYIYFVLFILLFYFSFDLFDEIISLLGIVTVCLVSNFIASNSNKISGFFLMIASVSYSIYLFHTTFEGFVKSAINKFPILVDSTNSLMFSVGAILVIGSGIIVPILLHEYIIEKNKTLCFLFGIKYNKNYKS